MAIVYTNAVLPVSAFQATHSFIVSAAIASGGSYGGSTSMAAVFDTPTNVLADDAVYASARATGGQISNLTAWFETSGQNLQPKHLISHAKIFVKGYLSGRTSANVFLVLGPTPNKVNYWNTGAVNVCGQVAAEISLSGVVGETFVCANLQHPILVCALTSGGLYAVSLLVDQNQRASGTPEFDWRVDYIKVQLGYDSSFTVTAQRNYPGTGASVGGAAVAWTTPQQVTATDGTFATQVASTAKTNNDYLESTNYGFTIPADGVIKGVAVSSRIVASAKIEYGDVQLIKGGVRAGTNFPHIWSGLSADRHAPVTYVSSILSVFFFASFDADMNLWGLSLTPADVNASTFGVAYRVNSDSDTVSRKIDIDATPITIFFTEPPTAEIKTSEYDFEISTPIVSINLIPQSSEYGYDVFSLSFYDGPSEYGIEIGSVGLTLNAGLQTSEYGSEIGSVALAQTHIVSPNSSEYGAELESFALGDFDSEYGVEIASVGITTTYAVVVSNSEYDSEIQSAFAFDPNVIAKGSEYGMEIGSVDLTQNHILGVQSSEYDCTIKGLPVLKQFFQGITPISRSKLVAQGTRVTNVTIQDRVRNV